MNKEKYPIGSRWQIANPNTITFDHTFTDCGIDCNFNCKDCGIMGNGQVGVLQQGDMVVVDKIKTSSGGEKDYILKLEKNNSVTERIDEKHMDKLLKPIDDIYSHTYRGWEILKLYDESKIDDNTVIKYMYKRTTDTKTLKEFLNHPHTLYRLTNLGKFKIIKPKLESKPATFEEVLNSDKKCRVEHELIKTLTKENCPRAEMANDNEYDWFCQYLGGGYLTLNILITVIFAWFNDEEVKRIIKEGAWYLEP